MIVADAGGSAVLRIDLGDGWESSHALDLWRLPVRPIGPTIYRLNGRRRREVDPTIIRRGALSRSVRDWAGEMLYEHMKDAREALRALVETAAQMQEDATGDIFFTLQQDADRNTLRSDDARAGVVATRAYKGREQKLRATLDHIDDDGATIDEYKIMSRAGRPATITAESIIRATARASRKIKGARPTTQQIADAHNPPVSRTHLARRRSSLVAPGELD